MLRYLLALLFVLGACHANPEVPLRVTRVEDPTHAEEYRCESNHDAERTDYTWFRQGWNRLPEGVKAEGNRLNFLRSTPDLNGLYICNAANQYGVATASFYRYIVRSEGNLLSWISNKVLGQ